MATFAPEKKKKIYHCVDCCTNEVRNECECNKQQDCNGECGCVCNFMMDGIVTVWNERGMSRWICHKCVSIVTLECGRNGKSLGC